MLPASWQVACRGSYVMYDIDFGHKGVDHFGVTLEVRTWLRLKCRGSSGPARIDTSRMQEPKATQVLNDICANIPEEPWSTDAHTHYATIAEHICGTLTAQFPRKQRPRKCSYFSPTTWDLRQQRVYLRKKIVWSSKGCLSSDLWAAFSQWSRGPNLLSWCIKSVARALSSLSTLRRSVADLKGLQPALKKSIRDDRRNYLSQIARSASQSTTKDVVQKLRPLLGPPRKKARGSVALPLIELEDGTIAQDVTQADQRWIRHFSSIEDGYPTGAGQHIEACLARQARLDVDSVQLTWNDVPHLLDIERSLRASQCGKAIGNDGVPADLLHLRAAAVSKAIYKVFLKAAFRLQEPIAWKGGTLHAIWKGKGRQADCASYRAILVSSSVGKAIHGTLRNKCSPLLDNACTPLQIGGRRGQPVQVATQAVRTFQHASLRQRQSCAVLFVDLREAFHRVVRPLVHGGTLNDHHVAGLVRELGLAPETIPRLHEYVKQQSLTQEAGASTWTARFMQEIGEDAWFTFGTTRGFAHVRGGTRPGDNLADLVFTFLFAEISNRIRKHLRDAGIVTDLPWNPSWLCMAAGAPAATTRCHPVDVTWMDDLSVLLQAPSPSQLIENLRLAATTTLDECLQAILLPNLRAGKTEAVVSLVGHGSQRTAKEVFAGTEPSLRLDSSLWPGARLRLVASYTHLGGVIQAGGGLKRELRARIGSAWQAFNKHRKLVFGSPIVAPQEKAVLFTSLVESTLYYGSGTWPNIGPDDITKLQSCLVRMARYMLRPKFTLDQACHLSQQYVLATARVAGPRTTLHVERLRHLKSVVLKASDELWAILHYDKDWLHLVEDSLAWLKEQYARAGASSTEWDTWDTAIAYIRSCPNGWKRTVNRAKQIAVLAELWHAEKQQYQGLAFRALCRAGAALPGTLVDAANTNEVCGVCSAVFDSLCSWSHHAFKRHGRIKPVRKLARGSQCPVCLRQYRANRDLCNHLSHSTRCRHALLNAGIEDTPAPGIGSRKFDDGKHCQLPVMQAQGPGNRWDFTPVCEEAESPCPAILEALEDCFCNEFCVYADQQQLTAAFQRVYKTQCLQISRLRATAYHWHNQLQSTLDDDDHFPLQWVIWHQQIARQLCDVDFVEWLGGEGEEGDRPLSTFRDAETLTPWLEFPTEFVPTVPTPSRPGVRYTPTDSEIAWICTPFRQCILHSQLQRSPELLVFEEVLKGLDSDEFILLSCEGLTKSLGLPHPLRSFRSIASPVVQLRLFSDLLRGAFFLWARRAPACVILPAVSCPIVEAFGKIAPFSKHVKGASVHANFALA